MIEQPQYVSRSTQIATQNMLQEHVLHARQKRDSSFAFLCFTRSSKPLTPSKGNHRRRAAAMSKAEFHEAPARREYLALALDWRHDMRGITLGRSVSAAALRPLYRRCRYGMSLTSLVVQFELFVSQLAPTRHGFRFLPCDSYMCVVRKTMWVRYRATCRRVLR